MKTYIIKAQWHATSKLLKIEAHTEEQALRLARRMKENKGHKELIVTRVQYDVTT